MENVRVTLEWYLSNVPFDANEDHIRDFLAQSGALVGPIRMLHDADGRFRGYCFAKVDIAGGEREMEQARRSIFGKKIVTPDHPRGREICVEVARPRRRPPELARWRDPQGVAA